MRISDLHKRVIASNQFDVDVLAFFQATGITDITIKNAVNDLVKNLKNNDIWGKLNVIYPFVGGTAFTHKFNLKDPRDLNVAFRATFFGGLTHDLNGITGNGTNGYFDTNYNDQANNILNDVSAWAYSRTDLARGADLLIGMNSGTGSIFLNPRNATDEIATRLQTTTVNFIDNTNSQGFYGITRDNSTGYNVFKNTIKYLVNSNSSGMQNLNIWGLRVLTTYSLRNISFMALGKSLNDTEALLLYNIIQNFQITLNRQV